MLALAIIATVFLSLKIVLGWLGLIVWYGDTEGKVDREAVKAIKSWGLTNIFILVTIWILYANLG